MKTRTGNTKQTSKLPSLLKIAGKLEDLVQKAAGSSWRERAMAALAGPDRNENVFRAAQILRGAGAIEVEEATFLMMTTIQQIAERRHGTDGELKRIRQAVKAADLAHGLKAGEYWVAEVAPEEVRKLWEVFARRVEAIQADVLRERGEVDLADLLLADRDALRARVKRGRSRMLESLPE